MAKKRFLQARPFLALGILAVVWLIAPLAVQSVTRISFYEFQAPAEQATSVIRDLQYYWGTRLHSKDELIAAGKEVAEANSRYALAVGENASLRAEVERLEKLINLPVRDGYTYVIARVARRDFSAWWQQIIIRKGRNYSIPVGAPVVFHGGVVGRVREVGFTTSIVDLISSQSVRLAANFEGDNRPVAYRGGPNPSFVNPRGTVEYVPNDIVAGRDTGLLIVTSGLGGVFPPGLPIGRVDQLRMGPDGQFKVGEVILDERLTSLNEVAVLIPVEKN